jgi:succinate-semialdehyde dehydrogenase / glutarate-semialdehyde dehydrogenase
MTVQLAAQHGAVARTVSPIDDTVIAEHPHSTAEELEAALVRSSETQRGWRARSADERADVLLRIADALTAHREELAALATLEMGKTITEARGDVDKSAWTCRYYAEHAERHLAALAVETDKPETYVQFPPLGVVLAVMPWNYPVWQVIRAAAPIWAAGNTVVLKHASNVTGSALRLAELFAGVAPDGALLETVVTGPEGVESLIADPRLAAVTLTGSEAAGVAVATSCARYLKKSVLELGGSDPFLVFADADLDRAASSAVTARFLNAGQSCIAGKRFIVVADVAREFEERFAAAVADLTFGDPRDESVKLGPMARVDLRDELADQVRRGLAEGGRLVCGGEIPDLPGAYYPPTIVADVEPGGVLAREETFGPAAAIIVARDETHAIEIANDSPFGLSATIWTTDAERAKRYAGGLSAGSVFVNLPSASDPRMPIGGTKRSGWGRELGAFGIREFVNVQGVTVAGP